MERLKSHECSLLSKKGNKMSVEQLKLTNGSVQWFLINSNNMHGEVVLHCPYCGIKLESEG